MTKKGGRDHFRLHGRWNFGTGFCTISAVLLTGMVASAEEHCSSSADADQDKSAADSDCDSPIESDYESCDTDFEDINP